MKRRSVLALLLSAVLIGCNTTGSPDGSESDEVSERNVYAKAEVLLEDDRTPFVRVVGTAHQEDKKGPVYLSISDIQKADREVLDQKKDVHGHLKLGGVT